MTKKWTKEEILNDLKRVLDKTGSLSRDDYRLKGKVPTSTIDRFFGDFATAKKELDTHFFEKTILSYIDKTKTSGGLDLEKACDDLNCGPGKIKATLQNLKNKGYAIVLKNKQFVLDKVPQYNTPFDYKIALNKVSHVIEFAVVSDTHFASIHECSEELDFFYKLASEEYGIKTFFHCGDLVAGINMYRGQENELKCWGADNQVDHFLNKYPQVQGATTYFITGNHDLSFLNNSGKDIGVDIASQRDDLIYLGQYLCNVSLGPTKLQLHHFDKAPSYAMSYPVQKTIEVTSDVDKPDLIFLGHLHQKLWLEQRGIHAFLAGCFERQSLWLKRKKLYPSIGGFIIQVGLDGDKVRTVTPTFVSCV